MKRVIRLVERLGAVTKNLFAQSSNEGRAGGLKNVQQESTARCLATSREEEDGDEDEEDDEQEGGEANKSKIHPRAQVVRPTGHKLLAPLVVVPGSEVSSDELKQEDDEDEDTVSAELQPKRRWTRNLSVLPNRVRRISSRQRYLIATTTEDYQHSRPIIRKNGQDGEGQDVSKPMQLDAANLAPEGTTTSTEQGESDDPAVPTPVGRAGTSFRLSIRGKGGALMRRPTAENERERQKMERRTRWEGMIGKPPVDKAEASEPLDVKHKIAQLRSPKVAADISRLRARAWYCSAILADIYVAAMVPVHLGFEQPPGVALTVFDILSEATNIADVFVQARHSFIDPQTNLRVDDPARCRKRYFSSNWAPVDVLSAVPVRFVQLVVQKV